MKRLVMIAAMLAVCGALAQDGGVWLNVMGNRWSPLTLGPAAWYRMENNLLDSSGNGLTTTVGAGDAAYIQGFVGQAWTNDATRYIAAGNPEQLRFTGSFTIACWARADAASGQFSDGIMNKFYATGNQRAITLERLGTSPFTTRAFVSSDGTASGGVSVTLTGSAWASGWRHLALVFDADAQKLTLYENGTASTSADVGFATIHNSTEQWVFGEVQRTAERRFRGAIDEVVMLARALTPAEILRLYQWRQ
jgi:hypothetical protein